MDTAPAFDGPKRGFLTGFTVPPIYDIDRTVDMLVETEKSFSRFGDGEFKLMTEPNLNHSFQCGSKELSERLVEILQSNDECVEIGINRIYFYKDGDELPYMENFIGRRGYGRLIVDKRYCDYLKRDHYYDSVFSIPYHHYSFPKDYFESYFGKVKRIWEGRDVYLVSGDTNIMGYDFNIFKETARNVKFVEIADHDAFQYRDRIMRYVKGLGVDRKNDIILFVCGLAATVMSYDMAVDGYRCIDVGHLAKEYRAFRHDIVPYSKEDKVFFE